jgi:hypothetical protein
MHVGEIMLPSLMHSTSPRHEHDIVRPDLTVVVQHELDLPDRQGMTLPPA